MEVRVDPALDPIPSKYRPYDCVEELGQAVRVAIRDHLIRRARTEPAFLKPEDVFRVVRPKTEVRALGDAVAYAVFAVTQQPAADLLANTARMFAGEVLPDSPWHIQAAVDVTEVPYSDFSEAKDSLQSLVNVIMKAAQAPGDYRTAFFQALTDELVPKLSQHLVMEALGQPGPASRATEGLGYVVLGVHTDWAPYFEVVRPSYLFGRPYEPRSDAVAILFRDIRGAQMWADAHQRAGAVAHDKQAAMLVLVEAAFRYHLGKTSP